MNAGLMAIVFGLLAGAGWGTGDFFGGLASKRAHTFVVVVLSQVVSAPVLFGLAVAFGEPWPNAFVVGLGLVFGTVGALALTTFYGALAGGRMGVVAPVSAIMAGALPVTVSLWLEGLPSLTVMLGLALALVAVGMISQSGDGAAAGRISLRELAQPLLAGTLFGLLFVLIDLVPEGWLFWPLVVGRMTSMTLLTTMALRQKHDFGAGREMWPLLAVTGLTDAAGNAFFVAAVQTGRLDVAAVLASMYPAVTVLLAWQVLKERLSVGQWVGVAVAIGAVVLIGL